MSHSRCFASPSAFPPNENFHVHEISLHRPHLHHAGRLIARDAAAFVFSTHQGTPTGKPTGKLKPGEYWWKPSFSLRERTGHRPRQRVPQRRRCMFIATAMTDRALQHQQRQRALRTTPPVASLAFSRRRRSITPGAKSTTTTRRCLSLQRLTWSGIAMHSGQPPGYAASHGCRCIRLPYDFFSVLLYEVDVVVAARS